MATNNYESASYLETIDVSSDEEDDHLLFKKDNLNLDNSYFSKGNDGKLHSMELNTNKAGMEGLDVAKINEIIQKASSGSKFYAHKQKCQERIDGKIAQITAMINTLTPEQIQHAKEEMTKLGIELEKTRDLSRTIVHIDMDMFYAAVEMRDDPSLKDRPMAVGGNSMLCTSNYAARKFGVRAGMPGFIGRKLCPDLILVPPNFDKYKKVSAEVQDIFKEYDPNFCPMSLDEAYLDITDFLNMHQNQYIPENLDQRTAAELVVEEIRKKIQEKTSLTGSAGIAANTRLAKVCSDMNKPDGQYYLPPQKDAIDKFIKNLPIRKISGIGSVMEQQLKALGVITCSDLWEHRGLLRLLFSETSYEYFMCIALGLGSNEISAGTERDRKSISTESTFAGTSDRKVLLGLCKQLCTDLKKDMVEKNVYGKVFTLKAKTTNFETRTRAKTLLEPTQDDSIMFSVCQRLLLHELNSENKSPPLSLRLLGVRMSNLIDKAQVSPKKQLTLTELFRKSFSNSETNKFEKGNVVSSSKDLNSNDYKSSFKESLLNDVETTTQTQYPNFKSKLSTKGDHIDSGSYDVKNSYFLSKQDEKANNGEKSSAYNLLSNIDDSLSDSDDEVRVIDTNHEKAYTEDTALIEAQSFVEKVHYTCPVCSRSTFNNITALNMHIDLCLNQGIVKELVEESNNQTSSQSNLNQQSSSNADASSISSAKLCCSDNNSKRKSKTKSKAIKKQKINSSSSKVLHKFLGLG